MLISGCEDERMFPYFLVSLVKYLTAIRRIGLLPKEVNRKFVESSDPITMCPGRMRFFAVVVRILRNTGSPVLQEVSNRNRATDSSVS